MNAAALRTIIFTLVMSLVSGAMLLGINVYTTPMIEKNEEMKLKSSVLDAIEILYEKKDTIDIFDKNVKTVKKGSLIFYTARDGAVAFEFSGPGLWGPISGIVSLEKDLKTIRSIKVTHQEETPGLGGRIAEKEYLKQFKAKEVSPRLVFTGEGKSKEKNEVDAITGATGSSKAFEKLINENMKKYLAALRG